MGEGVLGPSATSDGKDGQSSSSAADCTDAEKLALLLGPLGLALEVVKGEWAL